MDEKTRREQEVKKKIQEIIAAYEKLRVEYKTLAQHNEQLKRQNEQWKGHLQGGSPMSSEEMDKLIEENRVLKEHLARTQAQPVQEREAAAKIEALTHQIEALSHENAQLKNRAGELSDQQLGGQIADVFLEAKAGAQRIIDDAHAKGREITGDARKQVERILTDINLAEGQLRDIQSKLEEFILSSKLVVKDIDDRLLKTKLYFTDYLKEHQ